MTLQEVGPAGKATSLAKSGGEKDYGRGVRAAARALVTGVFDFFQFFDSLQSTVQRGLRRAFDDGLKEAGVSPGDINTPEFQPERLARDRLILENLSSINGFAEFIEERKEKFYDKGQKQKALTQVFNRSLLWSNQYDRMRVLAFTMASKDQKRKWFLGKTEVNCSSCALFEHRVYRASTWAKNRAIPKSSALCCTGRNCDCRLEPTTDQITRGRFPAKALCN